MNNDNAFELIEELKVMNGHLSKMRESLEWFNMLQGDRHQLEQKA
jgi:hypothetical protein